MNLTIDTHERLTEGAPTLNERPNFTYYTPILPYENLYLAYYCCSQQLGTR